VTKQNQAPSTTWFRPAAWEHRRAAHTAAAALLADYETRLRTSDHQVASIIAIAGALDGFQRSALLADFLAHAERYERQRPQLIAVIGELRADVEWLGQALDVPDNVHTEYTLRRRDCMQCDAFIVFSRFPVPWYLYRGGAGRRNSPASWIRLCGDCWDCLHDDLDYSTRHGYLIRDDADPLQSPVHTQRNGRRGWFLIDQAGELTPLHGDGEYDGAGRWHPLPVAAEKAS
jgi:hypothetical protein